MFSSRVLLNLSLPSVLQTTPTIICTYRLHIQQYDISRIRFSSLPQNTHARESTIEQELFHRERKRSRGTCETISHAECGGKAVDAQGRTAPKVAAAPTGQRGESVAVPAVSKCVRDEGRKKKAEFRTHLM